MVKAKLLMNLSELDFINKKLEKIFFLENKNLFEKGCFDEDFINKKTRFLSIPYNFIFLNYITKKEKNSLFHNGLDMTVNCIRTDGYCDEWYLNERSYCATSYFGMLLTDLILKKPELNNKYHQTILTLFTAIKNQFNLDVLNQNLAKIIFLENLNIIFIDIKIKKEIQKIIIKDLDKIKKYFLQKNSYEYGAIDLGYLSVSLMIITNHIIRNSSNSEKYDFLIETFILIYRNLTSDFNIFSPYIFSRSSRIFLISGFYYAYLLGKIRINEYENIKNHFFKTFDKFIERKELKYLSFFFSTDLRILSELIDFKASKRNDNNLIGNFNNLGLNIYKSKNFSVLNYYVNPHLLAIVNQSNCKYSFDFNLKNKDNELIPNKLIRIKKINNKLIIISKYSKKEDIKKYYKYINLISLLSYLKFFSKILSSISKYIVIKKKNVQESIIFKMIKIDNEKKIRINNRIYSKKKIIIKNSYNNGYFSPTSFISKEEILEKLILDQVLYKHNEFFCCKLSYDIIND